MTLLVLGISHRSAPLRVLDQLGLTEDEADRPGRGPGRLGGGLRGDRAATCNRVEVYADVTRFHPALSRRHRPARRSATGADRGPSSSTATCISTPRPSRTCSASRPVWTRWSSVRRRSSGRSGPAWCADRSRAPPAASSTRVVQRALRVGKRVHAETGIDRSGASVVSVALDLAATVLGDLADRRVLVVGAGSMGALSVATLAARGGASIVVANRTRDAAARGRRHPGRRAAIELDRPADGAWARSDLSVCAPARRTA